jgi:L-fuculose-phosphate aldolase
MNEGDARGQVIEAGKRLADRFFVASNDGNLSARLDDGTFLVTPSGVNKGDMAPADLLRVDADGRVLAGSRRPTSEMKMHLAVYRARPDVAGIVHAHPPAATGFAVCRIRLDRDVVLPEVVFGLGRIGFAEYGTPTTEEVPRAVEQEIGGCDAMLLSNHGALTVAADVMQAFYRMEVLEMYARVRLVTKILGEPRPLSESQVTELFRVRERQGWGPAQRALDDVDPKVVATIAEIVLQVLNAREGR